MSVQKQQDFAERMGYQRLGIREVEVHVPLMDNEKIEMGKHQSESICEIEKLEGELAKVKAEFKNKIEGHGMIVEQIAKILRAGKKPVKKKYPGFLDSRNQEKHFVDMDTGEVILTLPATEDDYQMELLS